MRIDASPTNASEFEPGIMLGEIKTCDLKYSRNSGDPYFHVSWHDAGTFGAGKFICKDVIMLAGGGRGIGLSKLRVLGFQEVKDGDGPPYIDAEAHDLVGRRAWIRLDWEDFERADGTSGRSLKVKTEMQPKFSSGYWHENTPPPEADKPLVDLGSTKKGPEIDDGEIPF